MTAQVNFDRVRTQTNRIASGSFYTDITSSGSMTGNLSIVLPPTAGVSGYGLVTNGSGVTSWSASGGINTLCLNSTGNIGKGASQTIYFIYNGTTSDSVSSRIYLSKVAPVTVTRVDIDIASTFSSTVTFNIQKNGTTQTSINTTGSTSSTVSVAFAAGEYLNVVMLTNTGSTDKSNVIVTLTYN